MRGQCHSGCHRLNLPAVAAQTREGDLAGNADREITEEDVQDAIRNAKVVEDYRAAVHAKSDLERQENKEKTGVALDGIVAVTILRARG